VVTHNSLAVAREFARPRLAVRPCWPNSAAPRTQRKTSPQGLILWCVRSFVPPILSHLKAHVWPSSNHQITFPGARAVFRDNCYLPRVVPLRDFTRIDMIFLSRISVPNWICSTNSFRYPCLVTT